MGLPLNNRAAERNAASGRDSTQATRLVRICFFALVAAFAPCGVGAQNPQFENRATLTGLVLTDDSRQRPVPAATVEIRALGRSVRTDSLGHYVLADIPLGVHAVNVRALGFAPVAAHVSFLRAQHVQRDFLLAGNAPVFLSPVEVTASSRLTEFDERRRLGRGHFITRSELESAGHRRLSEVLARLPGMRIQRHGAEASAVTGRGTITLQGSNPACYVHVYVDDAPVSNSVAQDFGKASRNRMSSAPVGVFNLNSLATLEIEAVEFYAGGSSIPSKYNRTGSACGVLLLWTRGYAQTQP